ncbi:TPA_asm: hypothetical protein vir515_00016 [Caudoviricetes sp. vir515]|jgi:predicted flap endonuclease-1-like 5' DNA nuclease|nr:TPA_asm: hypothetical protein vir515_00016 [Caudoviricetes sp. vir515]
MVPPPITLRISPNERATAPERYAACIDAALERGFEVVPDAGAEVDLVFSFQIGQDTMGRVMRCLGIDLKMPQDLIGSLQNGHLAEQRRGCTYPLRIAVLGSLGDVMRALPTVTKAGWRNPGEQAQAEGMVLRGIVALQASGVEVDFGWSPLDMPRTRMEVAGEWALQANVSQVMRRAEYILRSKIDLPRARCESAQEAMLRCLPGVGPETARAMVAAGIRPKLQGGILLDDLMKVPGIGKKKAEKILKALDG